MSILHSPRAPWIMVILYCLAASAFFLLAAGRDAGLLPAAVSERERISVLGELRRAITWGEEAMIDAEKAVVHRTGEALEHAGQKLEGWAGMDKAENATVMPAPVTVTASPTTPVKDAPGRFVSHDFALEEEGLRAAFITNRPPPQPRVFFIADPARWVVDVPGAWKNSARFNNTIAEGAVSKVVLGEHDKYLRIVFHFRDVTRLQPDRPPTITLEDRGLIVLVPDG